jgi:protoporphyrinogen oxidase
MKIAIIGAGLTGLSLADRLAGPGRKVTVFEREEQLGGLTTWHDYGAFVWDRFYHVILPSDAHLLNLIRILGLESNLRWARTKTGFYVDRAFHSMSSGLEFLRFRPVSMAGKFRLALTILYCARLTDWKALERVAVGDWLRRISGREVFEKIWQPLLLAKLGETYERVSAVFIWSYIKRMFSARDASTQKEMLGHVAGGYRTVFNRLAERIRSGGGEVRTGVRVQRIEPGGDGQLSVVSDGNAETFDRVVFTGPVDLLARLADPSLVRVDRPSGESVEYLGVVCLVLVSRQPLLPYYIVNIADSRIPFTGIIGMSTLVSIDETAGRYLTYLPKYVQSDDPWLRTSDDEVRRLFLHGLRLMLPDLDESGIESIHVNRAARVQPLQVLGYSELVPSVATRHEGFFILNTSRFVASTLNNNEVARAVDDFVAQFGRRFEPAQNENSVSRPTEQTVAVSS